jgi:hypothetical protein
MLPRKVLKAARTAMSREHHRFAFTYVARAMSWQETANITFWATVTETK